MRKVEIVAASCIALLAIVSIGEMYLDRQPDPSKDKPQIKKVAAQDQSQNEVKAVTIDEVVESYLPSVKEGTDVGRQVALASLLDELEGPEYGKAELNKDSQAGLAEASIEVVESTNAETAAAPELKARVAGFLTARTKTAASYEYALKTLDAGVPEARQAVLESVGSAHGVGGRKVYEKVQELAGKGLVAGESLPGILRRTGGKKAIGPITDLMKSTDNAALISACAISLQDTEDPSVMGPILERLEAVGLLDNAKKAPWISGALFENYMKTAEGSGMWRGVKLMRTRPSLVKRALPAIETALAKGDAETRRAAAEAVKKAVLLKSIDAKRGEELLAGRLSVETEPVLKAELTGGLEQVRGMIDGPKPVEVKPQ